MVRGRFTVPRLELAASAAGALALAAVLAAARRRRPGMKESAAR
jgi:hypothetical protein